MAVQAGGVHARTVVASEYRDWSTPKILLSLSGTATMQNGTAVVVAVAMYRAMRLAQGLAVGLVSGRNLRVSDYLVSDDLREHVAPLPPTSPAEASAVPRPAAGG